LPWPADLFPTGAFILAIACVIVFKLWLVRGEEIVGSATQYDALWYVRSARHWYWGTPYDWIAFIGPALILSGPRWCVGSIFHFGWRSNSCKPEARSLFSSLFAASV
jgi:hypothetical protein